MPSVARVRKMPRFAGNALAISLSLSLALTLAAGVIRPAGAYDSTRIDTLVNAGRYSEALAEIDRAIALKGRQPDLHFDRARVLALTGPVEQAVIEYEALVKASPDFIEARNNLAVLYASRGEYAAATQALETALRSDARFAAVYGNIVAVYDRLASEAYREALETDGNDTPLTLSASRDEYAAAIQALETTLRSDARFAAVYGNIVAVYDRLASEAYREALETDGHDVPLTLSAIGRPLTTPTAVETPAVSIAGTISSEPIDPVIANAVDESAVEAPADLGIALPDVAAVEPDRAPLPEAVTEEPERSEPDAREIADDVLVLELPPISGDSVEAETRSPEPPATAETDAGDEPPVKTAQRADNVETVEPPVVQTAPPEELTSVETEEPETMPEVATSTGSGSEPVAELVTDPLPTVAVASPATSPETPAVANTPTATEDADLVAESGDATRRESSVERELDADTTALISGAGITGANRPTAESSLEEVAATAITDAEPGPPRVTPSEPADSSTTTVEQVSVVTGAGQADEVAAAERTEDVETVSSGDVPSSVGAPDTATLDATAVEDVEESAPSKPIVIARIDEETWQRLYAEAAQEPPAEQPDSTGVGLAVTATASQDPESGNPGQTASAEPGTAVSTTGEAAPGAETLTPAVTVASAPSSEPVVDARAVESLDEAASSASQFEETAAPETSVAVVAATPPEEIEPDKNSEQSAGAVELPVTNSSTPQPATATPEAVRYSDDDLEFIADDEIVYAASTVSNAGYSGVELISEDYYLSHSDSALYTDAALITTIENWARAWSEQDVERYLSHYSDSFKPSNQSLDEWKDQQFRRIQWREFIIVKPSRIKVKVRGERATARFRQYYKSNLAEHTNRKTLTFQLEGGRWRITSDQS